MGRPDYLAIDVELQLMAGLIADAYRPRTPVAAQVIQILFVALCSAKDIVKHAKLGPGEVGGVQEPVEERPRFRVVTEF
jgi:hypothetical protein